MSVTSRDDVIIKQALIYAAHWIEGLPDRERESSNRNDMIQILHAMCEDGLMHEIDTYDGKLFRNTGRLFEVALET